MVLADHRSTGKLIKLERNGSISAKDYVRIADLRQPTAADAAAQPESTGGNEEESRVKPLTNANRLQIAQVREAALAKYLHDTPHMALALLAMAIDRSLWCQFGGSNLPLLMHLHDSKSNRPDDMHAPLMEAIESRVADRRHGVVRSMPGVDWYAGQSVEALHQIIADAMSLALVDPEACESQGRYNSVSEDAMQTIHSLMAASQINLSDYWQPDAAWLKSYGKANILRALDSIGHPIDGLEKRKLADLAALASEALASAGWLPEEACTP